MTNKDARKLHGLKTQRGKLRKKMSRERGTQYQFSLAKFKDLCKSIRELEGERE